MPTRKPAPAFPVCTTRIRGRYARRPSASLAASPAPAETHSSESCFGPVLFAVRGEIGQCALQSLNQTDVGRPSQHLSDCREIRVIVTDIDRFPVSRKRHYLEFSLTVQGDEAFRERFEVDDFRR